LPDDAADPAQCCVVSDPEGYVPITVSVGKNGGNRKKDVQYVQSLLNISRERNGQPLLKLDGLAGPKTIGAIELFQRQAVGMPAPDGRVDPAGRTLGVLEAANDAAARELIVYTGLALAFSVDPSMERPALNGRAVVDMIQTMATARG
jgi:peptidoglycan hydrolase-like protein with peptidoglycan-binding domain